MHVCSSSKGQQRAAAGGCPHLQQFAPVGASSKGKQGAEEVWKHTGAPARQRATKPATAASTKIHLTFSHTIAHSAAKKCCRKVASLLCFFMRKRKALKAILCLFKLKVNAQGIGFIFRLLSWRKLRLRKILLSFQRSLKLIS